MNPTLDKAAQQLVQDIASLGCSNALASVSAFQNVWNAANPSSPLGLSNVFDAATHAALSTVNATDHLGLTIPDVCVQPSGTLTLPTQTIMAPAPFGAQDWTPYLVAGGLLGGIVIGYLLWHHHSTLEGRLRMRSA